MNDHATTADRGTRMVVTGEELLVPGRPGLVSVILVTLNERENILNTVENVFRHVPDPLEIIIVDDDSPDQTWRVVADLQDARVKLVRRVGTRGLASAFLRGIIESRGDIVVWMDADMCMPPELLPRMIALLKDSDVVIGSRYAPGGLDARHPIRVCASRLINGFASFVLGYNIKDYDSGFVVVRRAVFDKVLPIPTGHGEYFIEFIYMCCRKGLSVHEVPYTFTDRTKGASKSFRNIWQFGVLGTKYAVRILRARFRHLD